MLQYIAAVIGAKMIYSRAKKMHELKELKTYGEKVNIPYLGEDVKEFRKKLIAERDRRLLIKSEEDSQWEARLIPENPTSEKDIVFNGGCSMNNLGKRIILFSKNAIS